MKNDYTIQVALVDDHVIVNKSICELITTLKNIRLWKNEKIFTNGAQIMNELKKSNDKPDIILLDIYLNNVSSDYFARHLARFYPSIKIIAFSGVAKEDEIKMMIEAGCCAYIDKLISPPEFEKALDDVYRTGKTSYKYVEPLKESHVFENARWPELTDREVEYLMLYIQGNSEKQIAERMYLSPKTMYDYKVRIFEKLNVKTRQEMIIKSLKRGIWGFEEE